jgi:hypothetical protein
MAAGVCFQSVSQKFWWLRGSIQHGAKKINFRAATDKQAHLFHAPERLRLQLCRMSPTVLRLYIVYGIVLDIARHELIKVYGAQ